MKLSLSVPCLPLLCACFLLPCFEAQAEMRSYTLRPQFDREATLNALKSKAEKDIKSRRHTNKSASENEERTASEDKIETMQRMNTKSYTYIKKHSKNSNFGGSDGSAAGAND